MKNFSTTFIAILFLISFVSVLPTSVNSTPVRIETETFVIGIDATTANRYNLSVEYEFVLMRNRSYAFVFVPHAEDLHNFVVGEKNKAYSGETVTDAATKITFIIGPTALGTEGVLTYTWTTPDEDAWYRYYCSVPGHFDLGMRGWIKVGNPGAKPSVGSPGFELLIGVLALAGVAIYKSRKQ